MRFVSRRSQAIVWSKQCSSDTDYHAHNSLSFVEAFVWFLFQISWLGREAATPSYRFLEHANLIPDVIVDRQVWSNRAVVFAWGGTMLTRCALFRSNHYQQHHAIRYLSAKVLLSFSCRIHNGCINFSDLSCVYLNGSLMIMDRTI